MCLLTEKCILNKNMPIEGSYFLGINSGSYSFDNLFLTSSLSFFLESQETSG